MAANTIIVADDDELIRELISTALQAAGYSTVQAPDGEGALAAARNMNGSLLMVVTDVMMPGMGGFELGKRLENEMPHVPTIFISGYDVEKRLDPTAFLKKPFTLDALVSKVKSAELAMSKG